MAFAAPDRFKPSPAFWRGLGKIGLAPAAVVGRAGVHMGVYAGGEGLVTTAEYFSLWRAIDELAADPAAGIKLATGLELKDQVPLSVAAHHARDFRDALNRMARFKQLCSTEQVRLTEKNGECVIELVWPYSAEAEPPLLTDAAFAAFVELGRRGTGRPLKPKRVELMRPSEATRAHEKYFNCPIRFRSGRNALVLNAADLDRTFVTYNAELLEMLNPGLEKALERQRAAGTILEQVKWVLKRLLAGNRPDVLVVARELGMSARTLQRRVTDSGSSFRSLLVDARRELCREYLSQSAVGINEAAYLLGFEDPNSFYRAFRSWEGTTPSSWRVRERAHRRK
jgi:AraC-like DNA-binding protein